MKKRVLVVYENMGQGHRRMAKILQGMIEADPELEISSVAGSELLGSSSATLIVNMWNYFLAKNWIRSLDILVNFLIRIFALPVLEASDTAKFWKKLEALEPDLIISTSDATNKVLGTFAAEKQIPFYIVITDIAIFTDLVHPDATHICYFPETARAVNSYDFTWTYFSQKLNLGTSLSAKVRYVLGCWYDHALHPITRSIFCHTSRVLPKRNDARTLVIGPLADRKHFQVHDRARLKEKLGLNNDLENVLIASGSVGGRFLKSTADILCATCRRPVNLLLMCGRDKPSYDACKEYVNKNPNVNIMPFEYVENFEEFLAVADCVVSRPSAGIFIESLLNRVPTISLGAVPSNDKGSFTIMQKYGTGEICTDPRNLPDMLERVLSHRTRYVQKIGALLNQSAPEFDDKAAIILNEVRSQFSVEPVAGKDIDVLAGDSYLAK